MGWGAKEQEAFMVYPSGQRAWNTTAGALQTQLGLHSAGLRAKPCRRFVLKDKLRWADAGAFVLILAGEGRPLHARSASLSYAPF